MDSLLQFGIDLIVQFQTIGWLEAPMKFFTFLGSQEFYLLVFPILLWSLNYDLGLRMSVMLAWCGGINEVFKLTFHQPRPYWVSSKVQALSAENSFGLSSGHASMATGIWGVMAIQLKRTWVTIASLFLITCIGISRIYLGVHFPHDVLAGWALGAVLLFVASFFWERVAAWAQRQSLWVQAGAAFVLSLLILLPGYLAYQNLANWVLPDAWIANVQLAKVQKTLEPVSLGNIITSAAILFGLLTGTSWLHKQGAYNTRGSLRDHVLRYVIGVAGVLVLWLGLRHFLPDGDAPVFYLLRYLHFASIGFWLTAGAPYTFVRLRLAQFGV